LQLLQATITRDEPDGTIYTLPVTSFLRFLMLLALIVWIGGILFFAFVEAPTLFTVLPSPQMAGNVVSPTLSKLHWIGLIAGLAFLIASLFYDRQKFARFKPFALSNIGSADADSDFDFTIRHYAAHARVAGPVTGHRKLAAHG
jgi:hypothetical protein